MGSPAEVVPVGEQLVSGGLRHELIAVVTQPARPVGRKQILTDPPLAQWAKSKNLLVLQPEKASDAGFLSELAKLKPDVIITAAYGQILSDAFLKIPARATINIHPSLLPRYRGATPVPATILDDVRDTGVSILFTVKALDAGNIVLAKH